MRKHLLAFLIGVSLLAPTAIYSQTVRVTPAERKLAEAITAERISSYLHFVASDAMGGRDTPSAGLDITAEFLKMNLQRWGFKPAGDNGTFFQKIALRRETPTAAGNTLKIGERTFAMGDDFVRLAGNATVSGKLVFGKDGWFVRAKNIDPLAGVDVKGKILVAAYAGDVRGGIPPRPAAITQDDTRGAKGTEWGNTIDNAKVKGASAVIIVVPDQMAGFWPQIRSQLSRGAMSPEKLRDDTETPDPMPVLLVTKKVADAIFEGETGDRNTAFELSKSADVKSSATTETLWTQNVVAVWEGSDPVLKNEMVAVGAHYDHVGTNPNAPGEDKIWNGADDDGSGTVAVLSIAEALSQSKVRPKRSILLVWHAGEEKGLWGAEYFNKFPTVDVKNVIAQLNIDMIGRSLDPANVIKCERPNMRCNEELSKANEIYVIGSEMMSSTLGAVTKGTNDAYLKLEYNYKYDDPKDPNRFFFRSDHFHYAVNGIPIAFWFDGVHEDYHQASDTADKIDYQKMEKVTRTIFLTMWELSDLKDRPKVDKQLPKELTER